MAYGLAGLLGAAVAIGCLVGYVPPYSWIADAQLSLMHTNLVSLSLFVTFAITSLPFVLAARLVESRIDPSGAASRKWDRLDVFLDTWPGKVLMVGATLFAMGGYLGYRDATRGPLTVIDVRDLERGEVPASTYVELRHARALDGASIDFQESSSTSTFVPIVSREDRRTAGVFAHYRTGIARDAPLRGPIDQDGLPGEIRSAYEDAHAIDSPHWVIDVGADPSERADFAVKMAVFGLVVSISALAWAIARRRSAS